MKPIFYRPAQLRGLAFLTLLLVVALAILGGMIWRNVRHFKTVFSYGSYPLSAIGRSIAITD
jgi:two-component system NtrC family sensor kinase